MPRHALPADEDGHALWLRYRAWGLAFGAESRLAWRRWAASVHLPERASPLLRAAAGELQAALHAITGRLPPLLAGTGRTPRPGSVVLAAGARAQALGIDTDTLGDEGYRLLARRRPPQLLIAARSDAGLLHGVFGLLRAVGSGAAPHALDLCSVPGLPLRLMDQADRLDRCAHGGDAGRSMWDWWKLPHLVDERYTDYARACASLGLNAVVLNHVDTRADVLGTAAIARAAALADVLRPWGLRVLLAVRPSAPQDQGGLPGADPQAARVARWWADKVAELFDAMPDFGGFLLADPEAANDDDPAADVDTDQRAAQTAGLLARLLGPRGSWLVWRLPHADAARVLPRAEMPANLLLQGRPGPLPGRRPAHQPLLGLRPGSATLVPLGAVNLAAVGNDRLWCGSLLAQADWYAAGRLAWQPTLDFAELQAEWARLTFGPSARVVRTVSGLLAEAADKAASALPPPGRTPRWHEGLARCDGGLALVARWQAAWAQLAGEVDGLRHRGVANQLAQQLHGLKQWRRASLALLQPEPDLPRAPGLPLLHHAAASIGPISLAYVPGPGP